MSDLEKAAQDAINAAANSEQLALITAVLKAQQLAQQPVTPPAPVAASPGGAAKWIGIGIGGSALLLAVAVSAIAIAISAVALTVCVLVLRSVWQDVRRKG
ncbi:hypothetical protein ACIO3R_32225 [Streptomyces sp. NPDC087428]|uniref:hypothetical protein n=1 Tax=Streptomyces sp. NPDC087428 TaxID=3365788 RepID=UPI0037F6EEE9